ncbi:2-nitropropane dioxygenase [Intrasporangium chromatireducens Q5-1]|uniref:Propionate 3-nitronate monooxygenase n=1 Tax=Intrasporangium chromatireducens Q5-1 TaxID=584657 RepID=W9GGB0_9MICO|nr:nitronate monooxygenase [Intrasporangium chromatireducens]EWT05271.1 2-nitropropane dioxygenase [Intrasporangium chromatireducens Q5-1]
MVVSELHVPIVGAPMAGGPSTPELAAVVSDAGGLGFIAAGMLDAPALHEQIAEVWARTERPFGVNLFVPATANTYAAQPRPLEGAERAHAVSAYRDRLVRDAARLGVEPGEGRPDDTDDWERKIDLVTRERVPVVSFTFGLPSAGVVHELQRSGTEVLVTVTDVDEARAAADHDVDGLCVQGPAAGGHRGTLDEAKGPSTDDLVDLVSSVRAAVDLPIVAAGGVSSPQGVAQLRAAGAAAIQVGTLLLLTPEAGTHLVHRRALSDPSFTETAVTRVFSGRLARSLVNDFVRAHDGTAPAAYPEVNHVAGPLRRASAAAEDPQWFALWAGTRWRDARPVPAAVVVRDLAASL